MNETSSRILVVDDEWPIRQQLSRAFELAGLPCDCAINGDEALDCFLDHHHRLVITDLRMPKKNGHSLAVSLLEQPNPPIVVALTGVMEPRLAEDLRLRGVADVVYKPLNYFALVDRLKTLIDTSPPQTACVGNPPRPRAAEVTVSSDASMYHNRSELEQLLMSSAPTHRWLKIAFQWIDWERVPNPPDEMQNVLPQLAECPSHMLSNGRRDSRIVFKEKAVAISLDNVFEPVGQPFKVITRDLSSNGVGFVHTDQLASELVAITWRGVRRNRIVLLTRPLRCRQVGAFFDVGAMIIRHS